MLLARRFLNSSLSYDTIESRYVNITLVIELQLAMEGQMAARNGKVPMNFKVMAQADVPRSRNGKHKQIVEKILSDLRQIPKGVALKVPLAQLSDSKEKVRSALNRATRKSERVVATASDETFLYVWDETL